ncbi:TonB-dependent receptor domain-containing protein [Inmirania thermothiophila]|uniref:Vitamin B12 transporter n=1 Tax=Inmirania thermothiophila TaxID=1750597 RepID=A0A3N1XZP7_9GAMM|nr:TonB-dependent receptor [Inmirania thermothiophila]ROR32049.1 vitamin B12 transporter [Inmirania thermothiophila]
MRKTALVAALLAAGPAVAAETAAPLIVTATRTAETADETLASVTVITREAIERSQVRSVQELLAGLPGIGIANNGGDGKATSLFLRGTESDHVLVLVDGVRVGSATLGTTAFEQLPLAEIERIEIVRGPRSALYGSEAIGGVIQIFTRRGGGPDLSAALGAGSRATASASLSLRGGGGKAWYALGLSGLDTDGIDACRGSLTEGCFAIKPDEDGYRNLGASLSLGGRVGDVEVELGWLRSEGETEFDGAFQNGADTLQEVVRLETRIERGEALWTVRLGRARDESDNTLDGAFVSRFVTERDSATVQADLPVGAGVLSLGVDYLDDEVGGTAGYAVETRRDTGVFAQWQAGSAAGDWALALRHDDNEQFGDHVTGSVAWGREVGAGLRLVAAYGTAFKAPTFNELYFPGFGNPDLDPERSRSVELGLRRRQWWSLTLFATRIDDLIGFDASFTPRNIDEARIVGLEGEAALRLGDWALRAGATLQEPENRGDGAERGNTLPRRARAFGRIELDRDRGRWSAGATLRAEGPRYDDLANTRRLAGYAVLDLRGAYRLSRALRLQARVENALDKDYETAAGYPQPGRGVFLTLRYARPRG